MPGILLYEARNSKTEVQKLYVGISKEGLNMEKTANQCHVILAFVSPRSVEKQEHMKQLNAIVKMIKSGESYTKLLDADDPQGALKAMMAR